MDDGDLDFSNPEAYLDTGGGCSMDSYFDGILNDTEHLACTHTHTCNPPVDDSSHTHTCVHVHTKVVSASSDGGADSLPENSGASKKRPSGNRAAVRKYREKKKAHTALLEEESHHNKKPVPSLFDLYGMAHSAPYKKAKAFSESDLDHPETFTNIYSRNKLVRYRDEGKARKGEDFNPSQDPFDTELVMISGGGRSHGSIAIDDGLIRCPKTLTQIKKRQSSSDPEIMSRARPSELAMAAALEKERANTQTLLEAARRQAEERERELEERTARLLEEERNQNDAQNRALYDILVSMCEKSGQTPPPMPQIAPATTNASRQASTDPSPSALGGTPTGPSPQSGTGAAPTGPSPP